MIALTHTVAGATIGLLSSNVLTAFIFGLFSHYILDFIPHSGYILFSFQKRDFRKIGLIKKFFSYKNILFVTDIGLSFIILFLILFRHIDKAVLIFFGFIGAVLPDILVFGCKIFPSMPKKIIFLKTCNKLHDVLHQSLPLKFKKTGFIIQLFFIFATLWAIFIFFPK